MVENEPVEGKNNLRLIAIITLILILVISSVFVVAFDVFNIFAEEDTGPHYTTTYAGITIEEAYDFINTTTNNLTIVETRSCKCKYNSGHIGDPPKFEAIHSSNWNVFYNTTDDLLLYDEKGELECIEFCENLVGHTYGKIYYLIGGFTAWSQAKYPSE